MPSDKPTLAGIRERSHYDQPGSDKALLLAALDAVLDECRHADEVEHAIDAAYRRPLSDGRADTSRIRAAISAYIDLGGES